MGGGAHFLKRIPRIKFPQRHPKPSASGSTSHTQDASSASLGSDVPAPPKNPGVGGKASLQPERTPVTAREIDAIIVDAFDDERRNLRAGNVNQYISQFVV